MASINDLEFQGIYEPVSSGVVPDGYTNFVVTITENKVTITSSENEITRFRVSDLPLSSTGTTPQWRTPRVPISTGGCVKYIVFFLTDPTTGGEDEIANPPFPAGLEIEWYNSLSSSTARGVSIDSSRSDNPNPESPIPAEELPDDCASTLPRSACRYRKPPPKKCKPSKEKKQRCQPQSRILAGLAELFSCSFTDRNKMIIAVILLIVVLALIC